MEDLSEREQLMFLQLIVTGVTFPAAGASASSEPFSSVSSGSFSGERAGPGAEKTRTRKETATAIASWPKPLPPKPTIIWCTFFPPKPAIIVPSLPSEVCTVKPSVKCVSETLEVKYPDGITTSF